MLHNDNFISRRIARSIGVVAAIFLFTGAVPAQVAPVDSSLAVHLREAGKSNPDLEAWQAKVDATAERVPQAGAWSDPMVTFGLANLPSNSFDFNQEAMTGAWITLAQQVPLTHRYGAAEAIAGTALKRDRSLLQNRRLTIAEQVAHGWYDWAYMRSAVATVDTTIGIVDGLIDVTLSRYETGKGLQQDVLRLQTERTRLEDRRAQFRQAALTAGRRFAVLLGRTPGNIPGPPSTLPDTYPALSDTALAGKLADANPMLKSVRAKASIADQNVAQAKRTWWPDLKLTAGYGYRQKADNGMDRPDFVTVTAGVSIPLFANSRQKPAIQQAVAEKKQAEADVRTTDLNLRLALASLVDQDNRLATQVALYDNGVLPQAQASFEATAAAFSTGKVDVDALLNAETALENARLERLARLRDRAKTRASIDALVGGTDLLNGPAKAGIDTDSER